jgi:hypothetical protein
VQRPHRQAPELAQSASAVHSVSHRGTGFDDDEQATQANASQQSRPSCPRTLRKVHVTSTAGFRIVISWV